MIKLPNVIREEKQCFFHPVLMDACFHTMLFLAKPYICTGTVALPASIRCLSCINKAERELTVFTRLVSTNDRHFEFDLAISDMNKNLIAELIGIKTHLITKKQKA